MRVRDIVMSYAKARDLRIVNGNLNAEILIFPVLTDAVYQIRKQNIMGREKFQEERMISNRWGRLATTMMHREYWGMAVADADDLNTYIDGIQERMQWHLMGLHRAAMNLFDMYEEDDRQVMAWCMVAHTLAAIGYQLKEKVYPPVKDRACEAIRKKTNEEYVTLDKLAVRLSAIRYERCGSRLLTSSSAIEAVNMAGRELCRFVIDSLNEDMDKEI